MHKRITVPEEILKSFKIKNIKNGFGHDLNGFYCDIFFKSKKVGYVNDDGWGGEVEIIIEPDAKSKIKTMFDKHDIAGKMFEEGGWNFLESKNNINFSDQVNEIVSLIDYQRQIEKLDKRFNKDQENAICYGLNKENYKMISWGKASLKRMIQSGLKTKIQDYIDTIIKPNLSEGETILNTNFEELGLVK